MVRVKLVPLEPFPNGALHKALVDQAPPLLTPLHAVEIEGECTYVILRDEVVAQRLWQYVNEHGLQLPSWKGQGLHHLFQTFELLPTDGLETVLDGYQISANEKHFDMTLSIHPHPTESGILIEAAPEANLGYAEAVADSILKMPMSVLGFRTMSPLSYLRFCIHQLTIHDVAPTGRLNPEHVEYERLHHLSYNVYKAVDILLHATETALVNSAYPAGGYTVQTCYPPASIEHPQRIKTDFVPPPDIETMPHRRLLEPLEAITTYNDVPDGVLLWFSPLPDSNEIICETAVPNDIRYVYSIKEFFEALVYYAAQQPNQLPLIGFRVTLLKMDISWMDGAKSNKAVLKAWKYFLRLAEIVDVNTE